LDTAPFRHYPLSLKAFRGLLTKKSTVAERTATSCYVATSPALAGVSGCHFGACNPIVPIDRATDEIAARRLWDVSAQLLKPWLCQNSREPNCGRSHILSQWLQIPAQYPQVLVNGRH
jgi:hypothetical protein